MTFWRLLLVLAGVELALTAMGIVWTHADGYTPAYTWTTSIAALAAQVLAGYVVRPSSRPKWVGAMAGIAAVLMGGVWSELTAMIGLWPPIDGVPVKSLAVWWGVSTWVAVTVVVLLVVLAAVCGFVGAWLRQRRTSRSAETAPVLTGSHWRRNVLLGGGVLGLVAVLGLGVAVFVGWNETEDPPTMANTWMGFVTSERYRGAYNVSSPGLRDQFGSADDLQQWFSRRDDQRPTTWTFADQGEQPSATIFRGRATFKDGHSGDIEVQVTLVQNLWRVDRFAFAAEH